MGENDLNELLPLKVTKLRKKIGRHEIIKGIDFHLQKGEVFGFLGPNGAGKTTTIRMLVGLIKPTSGSVYINGFNLQKQFTEAIAKLGCIVENPELYPYLSGYENLEYFSRMLSGVSIGDIQNVVELVKLENRIHDKVKTYSLGMRQRLGIAQALLNEPNVLILDEPTNGLDPNGIREMRSFIRNLAEEKGISVLVSSHLLSEIQLLCDRVAIIVNGEIIKTDTVSNLLDEKSFIIWRCQPIDKAYKILNEYTDCKLNGTDKIVSDDSEDAGDWNRALVASGIDVLEMRREFPTLEDLFLDLTGDESIV